MWPLGVPPSSRAVDEVPVKREYGVICEFPGSGLGLDLDPDFDSFQR